MVMKTSLKTLIIVLLTVMSFATAQAAFECDDQGSIELEGKVCAVQKDSKPYQIKIANDLNCDNTDDIVEIFGVPFRDLERELSEELEKEVTIDEGNCVTIKYYETLYGLDKFCSLLEYCDNCLEYCDDCDASDDGCYGDDMGERPFHKRRESPDHPPHPDHPHME